MCGRFGVEREYVQLALRYQAVVKVVDPGPRYNVAPTTRPRLSCRTMVSATSPTTVGASFHPGPGTSRSARG